jgi:hypothetical protein
MKRKVLAGFMMVVCVLLCASAWAGTADVPRILLVGDSWPGFMQLFRSFEASFTDYPALGGTGQRGSQTTEVGIRASEFNTPQYLDRVRQELLAYPTIDVVHLSLGGNDFVMDSNWTPTMQPGDLTTFINGVNGNTEAVIDYILAIRPNIRVAVCGYDFGNHSMGNGATIAQSNAVWVQFEHSRLDRFRVKPRTVYIHNLGLMQYYYNILLATPPVQAGTLPFPGGVAQNYTPFPGGDPNYNTPLEALMDDDLHLTMEGYDLLAHRCIDEFYGTWLAYPAVREILPLTADIGGPQQAFRVTFSKAVTGVDETDFAASGAKAATVVSVAGSGAVYTVTVNLGGETGPARLRILDDDTIVAASLAPLGGPGAGNGAFDHNGPLRFTDPAFTGTDDFDGAMRSLDDTFTPVAWMLGGQRFSPEACDANGGTISVNPPSIVGNQMLDGCELGLIYECLHNPALNLGATGGVSHSLVLDSWQRNTTQTLSDLGGPGGRITRSIPGLDTLLAGYMTLGNPQSTIVPALLMTAIGMVITLPPGVAIPMVQDYTTLGGYFGPDGDADGDGFTNRQEYDYFMALGGRNLYLMAALDPAVKPGVQSGGNSTGGAFNQGSALSLCIPGSINLSGGFQWRRDGQPLQNTTVLFGTRWSELHFARLGRNDGGVYDCVYDNGLRVFGPIIVSVNPLPAVSLAGLFVLGLAAAAFGARRLRRR